MVKRKLAQDFEDEERVVMGGEQEGEQMEEQMEADESSDFLDPSDFLDTSQVCGKMMQGI